MDIWQKCKGIKNISALNLEAWRIVEDQSRRSTRKLVESIEEYEILEAEIEQTKPRLTTESQRLHYLLFTAFRYPPLNHGSRFGKKIEPSLWYGSKEIQTAFAETAFYRFVLLFGSKIENKIDQVSKTAYLAKIHTKFGMDLTSGKFLSHRKMLSSPFNWKPSQMLGSSMRKNGVQAFTYFSARSRELEAKNVGIFSPLAFGLKKPLKLKNFIQFSNHSFVEFISPNEEDKYIFKKEDFMINNIFPFPPE